LLHALEIRRQAAVHGEDFFVNDRRDWQAIEAVGKCFPQLDIVPPLA
jgi:hypothetical protein